MCHVVKIWVSDAWIYSSNPVVLSVMPNRSGLIGIFSMTSGEVKEKGHLNYKHTLKYCDVKQGKRIFFFFVISILGFIVLGALDTFFVAHQSYNLCQGCWRKIMKLLEHGYHSPLISASPEPSIPSRISAECFWFLPFIVPNLNRSHLPGKSIWLSPDDPLSRHSGNEIILDSPLSLPFASYKPWCSVCLLHEDCFICSLAPAVIYRPNYLNSSLTGLTFPVILSSKLSLILSPRSTDLIM